MNFLQLTDKTILLFGVANRKSVAYHVSRVLEEAGAKCVYVVQNEAVRQSVAKLLGDKAEVHVCDVRHDDQIAALGQEVRRRHDQIDGLVHSIAFADYSDGMKPFHETDRAKFLEAVDVSCFSLTALCRELADRFSPDASVVTISISTTTMASENYGY
ncbi:MAG: SDR family oxidoreductase, partial [Pirellulales bacterium]|nr:SDR family oxidoreductase [Pirellulales bacterium]